MAAPKIILYLMCLLLWGKVQFAQLSVLEQQKGFIIADAGETVTLNCFNQGNFKNFYWYKHSLGENPELLATRVRFKGNTTLSDKFKNDSRFSVVAGEAINHLKILDVKMSDSAMYYCGMGHYYEIEFKGAIMLHVKGSSSSFQTIVQQPPEKPVHSGDSVTLTCIVHTAGTYYAEASCGKILSGNMTRLDTSQSQHYDLLSLVCCLGVALVISIILVIVLASINYKLKRETYGHSGHSLGSSGPPTNTMNEDNLHYAAVSLSKKGRPRPQRNNMENDTVYTGVRQQN